MNDTYARALAGTLRSEDDGAAGDFTIVNGLCVSLALWWLSEEGEQWGFDPQTGQAQDGAPPHPLQPAAQVLLPEVPAGYWWLLTTLGSGAFAAVVGKEAPKQPLPSRYLGTTRVTVSPDDLVAPNELGRPPQSDDRHVVPGNSPRVLVGCAMIAAPGALGSALTREQYWELTGDSYSLAPRERRTISYTETTGMETTTSSQETVARSIGASVSGGWGPVSASVSASLSSSSTTFQQVSLSSESTTFVSREVTNESETEAEVVLVWQLIDLVTVFEAKGGALASIVSAINPAIVQSSFYSPPRPAHAPRPPGRLTAPRVAHAG
jgi:hypothetical protein